MPKREFAAGRDISGKPASEWIEWAKARLVEGDPLHDGVAGVFAEIAQVTSWTYRD